MAYQQANHLYVLPLVYRSSTPSVTPVCTHLIRFLDLPSVSASLGEFVTHEEIVALLHRKDAILRYFDSMVREKGYAEVVLE